MICEEPTVFVVDDDPSVRRSLTRLILAMGLRVEAFPTAESYLRRDSCDGNSCIVLDLRMPGMSGLELQEVLGDEEYCPPVIFLTGHGDIPASVQAMKRGAVDFLQKPVEEADLERAIRAALERDRMLRRDHRRNEEIRALVASLTPREREVMEHVIAGQLNKQIASELGIAEKTVKVHRCRVMQKMRAGSVAELVRACELIDILPWTER